MTLSFLDSVIIRTMPYIALQSGFLYFSVYIYDLSMISWGLVGHLLLLNCISLYGYTEAFYSFIHWWTSWLSLIFGKCMTNSTIKFTYGGLCEYKFSCHLNDTVTGAWLIIWENYCLFLENCQVVFQSDCATWNSHHQWVRVPFAPCLWQSWYYQLESMKLTVS